MANFGVILVAAGKSSRFKDDVKKPYAEIDGRAVWLRAADLFVNRKDVVQTILVISADDEENVRRRYGPNMAFMNISLTLGGAQRHDSVAQGLSKMLDSVEYVAVHDAVRPCATAAMVDSVFSVAEKYGAAILAAPVTDTLKRSEDQQFIQATILRDGLWLAQTPQVFRRDILAEAYAKRSSHPNCTDDAQLVEAIGKPVAIVPSDFSNIKITTKADVYLADGIIKSRPKPKNRSFHPFADEDQWR